MRFSNFLGLCLIFILLPTVLCEGVRIASATETQGDIYFEPEESVFDVSETKIGDRFNVTLKASNMTSMWLFQIFLHYNSTLLKCTQVSLAPESPFNSYPCRFPSVIDEINGIVGILTHFTQSENGSYPSVDVFDAGVWVLEFEVSMMPYWGYVDSPLEFTGIGKIGGTYWLQSINGTPNGMRIPPNCINGYYLLSMESSDLPDIQVGGIRSENVAFVGDVSAVEVDVWDAGTSSESFNVTLYADANATAIGDEITVGMQTIFLLSRQGTTLAFNWNTSGIEEGNYTLSAVASQIPNETDTTNNQLTDGTITLFAPIPCQNIEITAPTNITLNPAIFSYNATLQGLQLSLGNMTITSTGDQGTLRAYGSANGSLHLWIDEAGLDWHTYYLPENGTIHVPLWLGFDPAAHWEEYSGTYTLQLTVCGTHRLAIAIDVIHFWVCRNGAHTDPNGTVTFTWNLTGGSLVYLTAEPDLPPDWTYSVEPPVGVFFETPQIVNVNITAALDAQEGDVGTVTLKAFKNETGMMIWQFTYFLTVGEKPPVIQEVKTPVHAPDGSLLFTTTVRDTSSGIEDVRLFYSVDGGQWNNMRMNWQDGDAFNPSEYVASLSFVPDNGSISYYVVATNWLGIQTQSETCTQNVTYDLAVLNASRNRDVVGEGGNFQFNMTVKNEGTFDEQSLKVAVYANTTLLKVQTVTSLAANQSTTLTFNCSTLNLPKGKYRIKGFVMPLVNESDTADNLLSSGYLTITIIGDINGDGIVEMMDFYYASMAYLSTPEKLNWNPNADVNDDGVVEMMDFFIVSQHYLEHL
jgi:hypothetical protein